MRTSILFALLALTFSGGFAIDGFDDETGTLSWPQYKPTDDQRVENSKVKRINLSYELYCQENGDKIEKVWFPLSKNRGKLKIQDTWVLCKLNDIMNRQKGALTKNPMTSSQSSSVAKELHGLFPNLKMIVLMGDVADISSLTPLTETLFRDGGNIFLYRDGESATQKPSVPPASPAEDAASSTSAQLNVKPVKKAHSSHTSKTSSPKADATKDGKGKSSATSQDDDSDALDGDDTSDYFAVVHDGVTFHDGGSYDWSTTPPTLQPSSLRSSPSYYSDDYESC